MASKGKFNKKNYNWDKDPRVTDQFVFFWKSWPSQWHMIDMMINGVTYNCCEQYMMSQKAILIGDNEILKKIMASSKPFEHKKLGQLVDNFNQKKWDANKFKIIYDANYAKFTQNIDLKHKLLSYVVFR